MAKKRKFKLMDAILGTVCLTLVCESVMPTAAIGNTQYFWWILLLVCFCLPYGMITAELGTTYPSEGGMYDWVKRAFGPKWAGRVAWNYWINFPLWISSLAVAVTDIIAGMFGVELSIVTLLCIQLLYIWFVTFLGTKRVGESKYIVNLGTVFKVVLLLGIGALGIYAFISTGHSANPITSAKDLFPGLNLSDLSFVSIILFNFMGFEVVGTWANDMDDPKKQIPKALIIGGLLMAFFYVLPATGFNVALPANADWIGAGAEIVVDVLNALFATVGLGASAIKVLVIIAGCMFVYTFIANIASWSFGVNEVAKYAAEDGSLPKAFTKTNKEGVPYMASIINGIVASIIVIAGIIASFVSESFEAGFSLFFCLSWITLLVGYIPMFLAFLKLRKTDKDAKRPYKVPGGNVMIHVAAIVPFVILILGVLFTLFGDFTKDYIMGNIPLIAGVVISFIIEEILVARIKDKKVKE
ncbi:MAG: APC family permease [Bacilli bacterium]|nr:APC family permease [Bacilli bacterium]